MTVTIENEFDPFDDLYSGIKKGLNKNILDNMVITKMKNVEKLDNDKKKCTICLENYKDGDDFIALPCIHIFHSDCIKTWLKNQTTCPICKNEIKYDSDAFSTSQQTQENTELVQQKYPPVKNKTRRIQNKNIK